MIVLVLLLIVVAIIAVWALGTAQASWRKTLKVEQKFATLRKSHDWLFNLHITERNNHTATMHRVDELEELYVELDDTALKLDPEAGLRIDVQPIETDLFGTPMEPPFCNNCHGPIGVTPPTTVSMVVPVDGGASTQEFEFNLCERCTA